MPFTITWERVFTDATATGSNDPSTGIIHLGGGTLLAFAQHNAGGVFPGTNRIYRSVDNGRTWASLATILAGESIGRLLSSVSTTAFLGERGTSGVGWSLRRSLDQGVTWGIVFTGLTGSKYTQSATVASGGRLIVGGEFSSGGEIIWSDDGGASWGNETTISPAWNAVRSLGYNAGTLLAGGFYGLGPSETKIARSTTNGASWIINANPLPGLVEGLSPIVWDILPLGGGIWLACGLGSDDVASQALLVWRSVDDGLTWTRIPTANFVGFSAALFYECGALLIWGIIGSWLP